MARSLESRTEDCGAEWRGEGDLQQEECHQWSYGRQAGSLQAAGIFFNCETSLINPNLTSIFLKTNSTRRVHFRPIDKITYLETIFFFKFKSQIIVEAFEHNVLKFEVVLVLIYFKSNTRQSGMIFHDNMYFGHYMPPPHNWHEISRQIFEWIVDCHVIFY